MAQSMEEQDLDGVPVPAAGPPQRRLRLVLDIEADDLTELAVALEMLAMDIATGQITEQTRRYASGGLTSGYGLTLTCDQDQTGGRYREQLSEWVRARKEARGG